MFKYFLIAASSFSFYLKGQNALQTPFEKSDGLKTATYKEGIEFYKTLAESSSKVQLFEFGMTDSGYPLHLAIWSNSKVSKSELSGSDKIKLLINNGIHPGEPDGIDASMLLLRDLTEGNIDKGKLDDLIIGVIPFYNIGGVLNRNSTTRVNQNGPESYGFRGNARNYDLNRDFIKADTENAKSFAQLFHFFNPDLFVDTHVSNGANYQHVLTIIETQKDKLSSDMGNLISKKITPHLINKLNEKDIPSVPFVNIYGTSPDNGYPQFFDYPRYSSGYASLFNVISFMTEAHMLKPFKQRVKATYSFLLELIYFSSENKEDIQKIRSESFKEYYSKDSLPTNWSLDKARYENIYFKGYKAGNEKSKVTGLNQLKYDESKPFTKEIPYYNTYKAINKRKIPDFYVVPNGWKNSVIKHLKRNNINYTLLAEDSTFYLETYHINSYETFNSPYEGHYPHFNVELKSKFGRREIPKGSLLIPLKQKGLKYIFTVFEPQSRDSFFNWNFFDTILQQKEHFSSYVFDDLAFELLESDKNLKETFQEKKATDSKFASNKNEQLNFIYKNSKYHEKEFLEYPIYKLYSK